MSRRSLQHLRAEARRFTDQFKAGGHDAPDAFRNLVQLLLGITVLDEDRGAVRLFTGPDGDTFALGSQEGPDVGIPLKDRRFLRLSMKIFVAPKPEQNYLKVTSSNYQYQLDPKEQQDRWIFRYEYLRKAPSVHPAAHLHVTGTFVHDCLPKKKTLARVHFPTGRVSIESVIRLLATHFFAVRCNVDESIWRPVLEQTESAFLEIAHRPRP